MDYAAPAPVAPQRDFEELHLRQKFLQETHAKASQAKFLSDVQAKVVEAPKQVKPKGIEGVKHK